jgi:prepilin-type N-terminal cleavage/methylation domain-containing protein
MISNEENGFTLIELLIVFVIIGVSAAIVLIVINPAQKLAATRDAGRLQGVSQIGHALTYYITNSLGIAVSESNWDAQLIQTGDLRLVPNNLNYSVNSAVPCETNVRGGGYCYDASDENGKLPAIIFARLESDLNVAKCSDSTQIPWAIFSTADARGGVVCTSSVDNPPTPGNQDFKD